MQYLDRITEAYEGLLGDSFQAESRSRINWICEHVQGQNVLDIGCSQGICEILLARKGIHVTGVDIAEESIDFARKLVEKEPVEFQNNIRLICGDFLSDPAQLELGIYDTILMTELLEHLEYPAKMIDRAMKYLDEAGRVIVTIPFGINDFPDHKHTFYLADMYEMLSQHICIETIEFMGNWIAFVGNKGKSTMESVAVDIGLLKQEEQAFWGLERTLRNQLNAANEKYKKAEENYKTAKDWLQSKNIQLDQLKSALREKEEQLEQKKLVETKLVQVMSENEKYAAQLKEAAIELTQEQKFLKEVKQQLQLLNSRYQQVCRKNKQYEEKLNKIYGTWYGKIALKAYKVLKRVKHLIMRR